MFQLQICTTDHLTIFKLTAIMYLYPCILRSLTAAPRRTVSACLECTVGLEDAFLGKVLVPGKAFLLLVLVPLVSLPRKKQTKT